MRAALFHRSIGESSQDLTPLIIVDVSSIWKSEDRICHHPRWKGNPLRFIIWELGKHSRNLERFTVSVTTNKIKEAAVFLRD